jgi:hypothetical protein
VVCQVSSLGQKPSLSGLFSNNNVSVTRFDADSQGALSALHQPQVAGSNVLDLSFKVSCIVYSPRHPSEGLVDVILRVTRDNVMANPIMQCLKSECVSARP